MCPGPDRAVPGSGGYGGRRLTGALRPVRWDGMDDPAIPGARVRLRPMRTGDVDAFHAWAAATRWWKA